MSRGDSMSFPIDELKNRLRFAMAKMNIRPIELSELTHIPKSSISQYMSGYSKPNSERVYLLSKALNVTEAWLLGFDVPREREETNSKDTDIYSCKLQDTSFFSKYMQLNKTGKEKAETYIEDLLVNPQYTVPCEHKELKLVAENKNSVPPIVDDITHT